MHSAARKKSKDDNNLPVAAARADPKGRLDPDTSANSIAQSPVYLRSARPAAPPVVQRQEETLEQEVPADRDEEAKPAAIQTKLTVGPPDDEYEREANEVAERVQRMPETMSGAPGDDESQSGATPLETEPFQTKTSTPLYLQRTCDQCGGIASCSDKCAGTVQLKAGGGAAPRPSAQVAKTINSSSAGTPLAGGIRRRVEPVLGRDLSKVRVHSDSAANKAAQDLGARAFTNRDHIYLGYGQSPHDVGLMAHEATHTVQQSESSTGQALQRDATNQSITSEYGLNLNDGDLLYEIETVSQMLRDTSTPEDQRQVLSENLDILQAEYCTRDPGAFATGFQEIPTQVSRGKFEGLIPAGGEPVDKVGVVGWDRDPQLRLRSAPDTSSDSNIIATLPFSTSVQVIKTFPGGWYFASTPSGDLGYVASDYIRLDAPEPGARLHRVKPGVSGTAIGIAEKYYGEYSDDWGQDLRFYVNVLAWANNIKVPDSTAGWRSVHFQAGQLIWIPSQEFAYSLKGAVNSGSYSYNVADFLGIAGFLERVGELWADFKQAISLSGDYIWKAITGRLTESLLAMAEGLAYLLLGAVALLAVTTAVGAILGGVFGVGAGAGPGAAAGFKVGMIIIEWLGLAMLIYWIGESLVALGSAFGRFLGTVWNARGDEKQLDLGARQFADAIALLIAKIFEALLMFLMAKGIPRGLKAIRGTRLGKALGEIRLIRWINQQSKAIEAGDAALPGPKQVIGKIKGAGRPGAEPAAMTRTGQTQHFHQLPIERLPRNLPEGHYWTRNSAGEWVLMRRAGYQEVPFELNVYSDGLGNTNYVLRSGNRMIQSDALTRQGGTYRRGQQRLPDELEGVGQNNPYRDPVTGELYDKGHGVDYADTLEGPGVRSSTTDPANFTPQASWWNRGPRKTLVGRIRNGHAQSGRPGGGGYREMAIYGENPPVTANGTPIPREFVFVETNRAGVAIRAWRIPNQPGAGTRALSSLNGRGISLSEVPPVMLRSGVPLQSPGAGMIYSPFAIFGIRGDDESPDASGMDELICVEKPQALSVDEKPLFGGMCE